jgi:hypothetical protein
MAHGGAREGAGRGKGSKGKRTLAVEETLERLNCDPIEGMALIAMGSVPCLSCSETGTVTSIQFYQIINKPVPDWVISDADSPDTLNNESTRPVSCPLCGGTGIDPINISLRSSMHKELAQYIAPKRKAIEMEHDITDRLSSLLEGMDGDSLDLPDGEDGNS